MITLPLEEIKEIFWKDEKIHILYKDGTKMIANAKDTKLIAGYLNDSEIPLNDHCL